MAFAEDKGPARARGWPAGRGAATEQGVQDKRSPAQTARARAQAGRRRGAGPRPCSARAGSHGPTRSCGLRLSMNSSQQLPSARPGAWIEQGLFLLLSRVRGPRESPAQCGGDGHCPRGLAKPPAQRAAEGPGRAAALRSRLRPPGETYVSSSFFMSLERNFSLKLVRVTSPGYFRSSKFSSDTSWSSASEEAKEGAAGSDCKRPAGRGFNRWRARSRPGLRRGPSEQRPQARPGVSHPLGKGGECPHQTQETAPRGVAPSASARAARQQETLTSSASPHGVASSSGR